MVLKKVFGGVASKVLGLDNTTKPASQIELLQTFLDRHRFVFSPDLHDCLATLKKKHLVDEIIVASKDGTLLVGSGNNGALEALTGSALFNYVKNELPKTETLFVKQKDHWFMVIPSEEKVFIIRASAELSNIELKALAREVEEVVLSKQKQKSFLIN